MKKLLIFSATLLLAVLFVLAMSSGSNMQPSRSGVSVLTNSSALPTQTNVAPGTFAAKPYSMTVVVLQTVDEKMVVGTNAPETKMPVVKPEIRLEKQ